MHWQGQKIELISKHPMWCNMTLPPTVIGRGVARWPPGNGGTDRLKARNLGYKKDTKCVTDSTLHLVVMVRAWRCEGGRRTETLLDRVEEEK